MSEFVLTQAAKGDLLKILEYLEGDNPTAVLKWSVFSYLVIYRPDTTPLEIVRVLHGKRDVRRLLEE